MSGRRVGASFGRGEGKATPLGHRDGAHPPLGAAGVVRQLPPPPGRWEGPCKPRASDGHLLPLPLQCSLYAP